MPSLPESLRSVISRLCGERFHTLSDLALALEQVLPDALGVGQALLLQRRSRSWHTVTSKGRVSPQVDTAQLPHAALNSAEPCLVQDSRLAVMPIWPGKLALVLIGLKVEPAFQDVVGILAPVVRLAAESIELRDEGRQNLEEVLALQTVAKEILSVGDIDNVLLSITQTALRLLSADIAGVFLREEEEIVMRSCVGHWCTATATVRMRSGQGLAGRVFETRQPVQVDDYLATDAISNDFIWIAEEERMRSALGAPLSVRGEVIGVLEVWRRRRSVFSAREVRRLVAMADLAAIAIDNARNYAAQVTSVRLLEVTNSTLERQLGVLEQSNDLQHALIEVLLAGGGLPAIARTAATLTQSSVLIMSPSLEILGAHPSDFPTQAVMAGILHHVQKVRWMQPSMHPTVLTVIAGTRIALRAIRVSDEVLGFVCLANPDMSDPSLEMATGQVALITALHAMEQRAREDAWAGVRGEIVWSLLQGSAEAREAAANRARRLHIDLRQPQRVFCCALRGLEMATGGDISLPERERTRRELRGIVQRVATRHGAPEVVTVRDDLIVGFVPCRERSQVQELMREATAEMRAAVPMVSPVWGVSQVHGDPLQYATAYAEAQTALKAARQLATPNPVVLFDDLGMTALLLAPADQPALSRFVEQTIGAVLEYDRAHQTDFVRTLRTYLSCDCSLAATARQLHVHEKTVRYRLDRMQHLGLFDLRSSEDRFRVDLALRILDTMSLLSSHE